MIFEILTKNRELIYVKSNQPIAETAKVLKKEHGVEAYSYTEIDSREEDDVCVDYTV